MIENTKIIVQTVFSNLSPWINLQQCKLNQNNIIISITLRIAILYKELAEWICRQILSLIPDKFRSRRCSVRKGVLRNFAKLTGKHLFHSLFFNKVADMTLTLLKKRLWHRCFPVNFAKFLKTPLGECLCKLVIKSISSNWLRYNHLINSFMMEAVIT